MKAFVTISTVLAYFWTSIAFGDTISPCVKPVTLLQKGEGAPCQGYLFSPEKELQVRLLNEDNKVLTEKLQLYQEEIQLYQQQNKNYQDISTMEAQKAEVWRKAAEDATMKLNQEDKDRSLRDWLYLLGGVGLTALAGWTIGQAARK